MSGSLFVQRFLVVSDEGPDRPAGARYDPALALNIGADGRPVASEAGPRASATETKGYPGDRDAASALGDKVTKTMRDKPVSMAGFLATRTRRDPSPRHAVPAAMWTRLSTQGRDTSEEKGPAVGAETRVRRSVSAEQPVSPSRL
jgi:hypothetical protein